MESRNPEVYNCDAIKLTHRLFVTGLRKINIQGVFFMSRKIKFYSLIILFLAMAGCTSFDDGYDDPINIRTFNTTYEEDRYMQKYFRAYVNRISGESLVGTYSETRSARYTMKITVLEKETETAGNRLHTSTDTGSKKSDPAYLYSYKIKIDMIDNKNNGLVWTWAPEKWKTYPTKQKSIKWLAKYSSKRMIKEGLFRSK